MNVYISGAACRAVFVDGTGMFYVDLDCPDERIQFGNKEYSIAAISQVLGNAPDIRLLSTQNVEEGLKCLHFDGSKDGALRLFEVAMELQGDIELAVDAARILDPVLQNKDAFEFLRNYAFSIPFYLPADQTAPPKEMEQFQVVFELVRQVYSAQPQISLIRSAWDEVAGAHFPIQIQRHQGEKTFVECGAFCFIHEAMMGRMHRNDLMINLLLAGRNVYRCRDITQAWLDALNL